MGNQRRLVHLILPSRGPQFAFAGLGSLVVVGVVVGVVVVEMTKVSEALLLFLPPALLFSLASCS